MKTLIRIWMIVLWSVGMALAQRGGEDLVLAGSAFLQNHSYAFLQKLCDEAGGRLVGTPSNEKALRILQEELRKMGLRPETERFRMPGWIRGNDRVEMLTPVARHLQAVALGYSPRTPAFSAELVYAGFGFPEAYNHLDVEGKIVLVTSRRPPGKTPLLRMEAIRIAAEMGARAILFINRKKGTINLAGVGNFQGKPTAIPAFSLTYEEGEWLRRLCQKEEPVTLRLEVNSHCQEVETANVVVRFPGEVKKKIVVGAHLDSWDLGQGSIDNGLGTAILFDVARLLYQFALHNYYTVELVWFNGEELGLWGSKKYLEQHGAEDIALMINLDMTGSPTGFNAMGREDLVPVLEKLLPEFNGFNLTRGVINQPWTNSDHMPFMLQGIPTLTLTAHLDEDMGRYYHSLGDSFDKVNRKYLSEAAGVVSVLIFKLANDRKFALPRFSPRQTAAMLQKYKLDERLKRQGEWPF